MKLGAGARLLILGALVASAAAALVQGTRPGAASPSRAVAEAPGAGAGPAIAGRHPVTVRQPAPTLGVPTGSVDLLGRPIVVSCVECHSLLEAPAAERPLALENLESFHKGLAIEHGSLTCAACHDPEEPHSLRLADGRRLPVSRAMELCSQCHGPQRTDFDNGAHGGMTGYWDLTRGPRTRNGCTACHDPHVPAMPRVRPTFKPVDRFLNGPSTDGGDEPHE